MSQNNVTDVMLLSKIGDLTYHIGLINYKGLLGQVDYMKVEKEGDIYSLMMKKEGDKSAQPFCRCESKEQLYDNLCAYIDIAKNHRLVHCLIGMYINRERESWFSRAAFYEAGNKKFIKKCKNEYPYFLKHIFSKEWQVLENINPELLAGNEEALEVQEAINAKKDKQFKNLIAKGEKEFKKYMYELRKPRMTAMDKLIASMMVFIMACIVWFIGVKI